MRSVTFALPGAQATPLSWAPDRDVVLLSATGSKGADIVVSLDQSVDPNAVVNTPGVYSQLIALLNDAVVQPLSWPVGAGETVYVWSDSGLFLTLSYEEAV
jgi:hypothetical protein